LQELQEKDAYWQRLNSNLFFNSATPELLQLLNSCMKIPVAVDRSVQYLSSANAVL
jgi:hypothetical protein